MTSPYLLRPVRSLAQVQADMARSRRQETETGNSANDNILAGISLVLAQAFLLLGMWVLFLAIAYAFGAFD